MKTFKLILKSLIKNDSCIEGGRHHPWWVAVIIFIFSMVVAVVPILVQTSTKAGSSFASSVTYNIDVGLQRFVEESNDNEIQMIIKNDDSLGHYLDLDVNTWNEAYETQDHAGFNMYQHFNRDLVSDFDVFYIPDLTSDDLTKIIKEDKEIIEEGKETTWGARTTSFMVFAKTEYVIYQYNGESSSTTGYTYGDYKEINVGSNILDIEKVDIDGTIYTHNDFTLETSDKYKKYTDGVWSNWKNFFDKGYLYQRGQLTWKTTLLMLAINAGITIFMGLMIWILTRGKSNPYRIYTFFECQFIGFWSALSPAILSLILGFMLSSFTQIMFPLLIGVRVMWLSMKSLRPEYVAAPQQNKKYVKTVDTKAVKEDKKK